MKASGTNTVKMLIIELSILLLISILCILYLKYVPLQLVPDTSVVFFKSDNSNIYYDITVPISDKERVMEGCSILPESIQKKLRDNHVNIYIYPAEKETNQEVASKVYGVTLTGVKSPFGYIRSPKVYIFNDHLSKHGTDTIIHEVGHVLDDLYKPHSFEYYPASNSSEFKRLMDRYRDRIASYDKLTEVNSYSYEELYAESFRISIEDPDYLRRYTPGVYEYMLKTGYK